MSLNASAKELLTQLLGIIEQMKEEEYSRPISELSNSTIGQHIRHTLEFFLCLMDARTVGRINYDHRKHDQLIETDIELAQNVIVSIVEFLQKETDDFSVIHEANYEFEEKEEIAMPSSFYRELAYNIEHAIHHMALIKVGLRAGFNHIEIPEHFGVASSTVRYRQLEK